MVSTFVFSAARDEGVWIGTLVSVLSVVSLREEGIHEEVGKKRECELGV